MKSNAHCFPRIRGASPWTQVSPARSPPKEQLLMRCLPRSPRNNENKGGPSVHPEQGLVIPWTELERPPSGPLL